MQVYINEVSTPTLKVGRLAGDTLEGGILLQGPGYFARMTVTPGVTDGLPANPIPTSRPRIRDWSPGGALLRSHRCHPTRNRHSPTCRVMRRLGDPSRQRPAG
jgi:hypothetical protein